MLEVKKSKILINFESSENSLEAVITHPWVLLSDSGCSDCHFQGFPALATAEIRTGLKRVFNDFLIFTQLYRLSGGNQVDGLPPAASFLAT